jgi:hypothetical protein
MFSYRKFLKESWQLSKNYKYLWFFGLFSAFLYLGGEYQVIATFIEQSDGLITINTWLIVLAGLFTNAFWSGLLEIFNQNIALFWTIISLFLLALAIFIIIVYIAVISQAALISQIIRIHGSKRKITNFSISDSFQKGKKWFWSLLWVNISSKVLITLIFTLLSLPLLFIYITNSYFSVIIYILLFLIFIPLALSISFIMKYAMVSVVSNNKKSLEAIEEGWRVFKKNWLVSFEMAFILFVINFLIGFLILIFISLLFGPMILLGVDISSAFLIALGLLLSISSMILTATLLSVFQTATWTKLFLKIKNAKGSSKLERMFAKK